MGFLSVLSMAQRWAADRLTPGSAAVDATAGGGVDTLFLARACGPEGRVYAFDVQPSALRRTRERLASAALAEEERRDAAADARGGGEAGEGGDARGSGTADVRGGGEAGEGGERLLLERRPGRRASGGGPAPPGLAPVELLLAGHERMAELIAPAYRGRIRAVMFNLGYLPGEGEDRSVVTRPETTVAALDAALGLLAPKGIITAVLYPGHEGGDMESAAVEAWAAELPAAQAQSVLYRLPQKPSAPYLIAIEKRADSDRHSNG